MSARFRELDQSFDNGEVALGNPVRVRRSVDDARSLRQRLALPIFACQQTACQRKEWQERELQLFAFSQNAVFRVALQQAIFLLHTDKPRLPNPFFLRFSPAYLFNREI